MRKLIYGVGINDADYSVSPKINGKSKKCQFYTSWHSMLNRCYCTKYQSRKPSYIGCQVCNEWKNFSRFKAWMEKQDWEGKHLDKDILIKGNKLYSPETCVFVSQIVNSFINSSGELEPKGFYFDKLSGKFRAECGNPLTKKKESLGSFAHPILAHEAWRKRKHELALQLADMQDDPRVAAALRVRYLL